MARFKQETIENLKVREKGSPEELIIARLEAKRWLELSELLTQIAWPPDDVKLIIEGLISRGEVLQLGQGEHSLQLALTAWNTLAHWKRGMQRKNTITNFRCAAGIPKTELSNRLKLGKYAPLIHG
jgi:hypothetical protein